MQIAKGFKEYIKAIMIWGLPGVYLAILVLFAYYIATNVTMH